MYKFKHDVTRNMIDDIEMDRPISMAAICDYGLENPAHRKAFLDVVYEYKNYQPFLEALDEALGNGEKITSLVNSFTTQQRGLIFVTAWDQMGEEDEE
jgi:hypothetical protein